MPGEVKEAKRLVAKAMTNEAFDKDTMGRAIINAVIERYGEYRSSADVASELQFIIDNLGEDEFVENEAAAMKAWLCDRAATLCSTTDFAVVAGPVAVGPAAVAPAADLAGRVVPCGPPPAADQCTGRREPVDR
jgi:hypothetical protein